MHTFEVKKEKLVQQIEREGSIKGEGGLYIKTKNFYSPSKVAKEWRNIPFQHSIMGSIITRAQWGSECRNSPLFKWLRLVQSSNGLAFEHFQIPAQYKN